MDQTRHTHRGLCSLVYTVAKMFCNLKRRTSVSYWRRSGTGSPSPFRSVFLRLVSSEYDPGKSLDQPLCTDMDISKCEVIVLCT